LNKVKH